jgi:DEAD/DEAH box helicase
MRRDARRDAACTLSLGKRRRRGGRGQPLHARACDVAISAPCAAAQVTSTLYQSNDSALVCAPAGSGKTVCAELALLRLIAEVEAKSREAEGDDRVVVPPLRAVYVAPLAAIVKATRALWAPRFGPDGLGLSVAELTGEQQVRRTVTHSKSLLFVPIASAADVYKRGPGTRSGSIASCDHSGNPRWVMC